MFSTTTGLDAVDFLDNGIADGRRVTLRKGQAITFADLPNQPVAIVVYNNTGDKTEFNVVYNNQCPETFNVDSVQAQGFSLGLAYLINPAKTHANEISVSVPNFAAANASVDVYAVSLYLPRRDIQNQEIPLNGKEIQFSGYSRAYATPPLAWYQQTIKSNMTGSIGLQFYNDTISVIGVNVPKEIEPVIKSKIINSAGSGLSTEQLLIKCESGNVFVNNFYGTSSQIVYSPVSSARTTSNGSLAIQRLS
ncbi:hypothetical protein [Citrobacter amalonaticus]|uniref:hypothetical protein n=1 Tax=Citrobacter amalonaticus TaxID=35703 RepID=UPI001A22AA60|nr:hypothetical protein [Citrobacter amalonaticus]HDQ2812952.1 hypothetical protein [Citrobacter amalonaticus]